MIMENGRQKHSPRGLQPFCFYKSRGEDTATKKPAIQAIFFFLEPAANR